MNTIALDAGGTAVKYAFFTGDTIMFQGESPSNTQFGGRHFVDSMRAVIRSCLERAPADIIGISTTGQVDARDGSILYANSSIAGYRGMKVKDLLESEFRLPVRIENDVASAAIGECVYGAGKPYNDFIMTTYGTGIGGAAVINRRLYRGNGQACGAVGHLRIHPGGRLCTGCGQKGCYEMYASTSVLVKQAQALNPALDNGRKIFQAFDGGDQKINELVDNWITEISYGLINLIHIFNPPCIILGGGVFSQPYILQKLQEIVNQEILDSFRPVELLAASLGNLAGVYGIKAVCCGDYT